MLINEGIYIYAGEAGAISKFQALSPWKLSIIVVYALFVRCQRGFQVEYLFKIDFRLCRRLQRHRTP